MPLSSLLPSLPLQADHLRRLPVCYPRPSEPPPNVASPANAGPNHRAPPTTTSHRPSALLPRHLPSSHRLPPFLLPWSLALHPSSMLATRFTTNCHPSCLPLGHPPPSPSSPPHAIISAAPLPRFHHGWPTPMAATSHQAIGRATPLPPSIAHRSMPPSEVPPLPMSPIADMPFFLRHPCCSPPWPLPNTGHPHPPWMLPPYSHPSSTLILHGSAYSSFTRARSLLMATHLPPSLAMSPSSPPNPLHGSRPSIEPSPEKSTAIFSSSLLSKHCHGHCLSSTHAPLYLLPHSKIPRPSFLSWPSISNATIASISRCRCVGSGLNFDEYQNI